MSSNSSGKKLEGFFTGKGFYIVLFLCAAVIGVSAWMMAAGDVAMKNEVPVRSNVNMENKRVETVIIPAETAAPAAEAPVFGEAEPVTGGDEEIAAEAPEISAEGINAPVSEPEDIEAVDVWKEGDVMEVAAPMYVWPLSGELERLYSVDTLSYDVTMRDWRTHDGIDVQADEGAAVKTAAAGTVQSVTDDELMGTTVVIQHDGGYATQYSSLQENTPVAQGQTVAAGEVIGYVGSTSAAESRMGPHLHFSVSRDGAVIDPHDYVNGGE